MSKKKWRPELWEPVDIKVEVPDRPPYGPSEVHQGFYSPQDPKYAYEVRGAGPTYRKNLDPKRDSY